jgi:LPXTG-motif cell wall-anchored protein
MGGGEQILVNQEANQKLTIREEVSKPSFVWIATMGALLILGALILYFKKKV